MHYQRDPPVVSLFLPKFYIFGAAWAGTSEGVSVALTSNL